MSDGARTAAPLSERLVRAFVDVADTLADDYDVVALLHRLCGYCTNLLGAADGEVTLADQQGGLQLLAASTQRARRLGLFEVHADQGPCVDAYRTGEPLHADDLATMAGVWPRFALRAIRDGYRSVQAVPLRLRTDVIGALNLFGRQRAGPLDRDNLVIARALADTATTGILHERAIRQGEIVTEQLQTALNSRIVIEQAKGILVYTGHIPPDQAFERLRRYSRQHNTRLTEVVKQVIDGSIELRSILELRPPSRG